MKIELKLSDIKELLSGPNEAVPTPNGNESVFIGERVIVRSRDAGVMYGTLKKLSGRYVLLENARIMWRWRNKNGGVSLNDTAVDGLKDDDYSRLSNFNEKLEMLEACSIIEVSKKAEKNLDSRHPYDSEA